MSPSPKIILAFKLALQQGTITKFKMAALLGWETFFKGLEGFIASLRQQAGTSSREALCHYAIERFEVCIVNLSRLLALLRAPHRLPQARKSSIIVNYCAHLSQPLQCLRPISLEWQGYIKTIELQTLQSAYRPDHNQPSAGIGLANHDLT